MWQELVCECKGTTNLKDYWSEVSVSNVLLLLLTKSLRVWYLLFMNYEEIVLSVGSKYKN